jgi:hypothetical protein
MAPSFEGQEIRVQGRVVFRAVRYAGWLAWLWVPN